LDNQYDEETARLDARSNELTERSRDAQERAVRASSTLKRVLKRCDEARAVADRLYGRSSPDAESAPEAWPEEPYVA